MVKGSTIEKLVLGGPPFFFGLLCFYLLFSHWSYVVATDTATGSRTVISSIVLGIALCLLGVLLMLGALGSNSDD